MNVLIVGAGKSGVYLAEKLRANHKVTLIEVRPDRVDYVASRLPGCRVLRGDGCEPAVLDRAGVGSADLVAALTGDDEDNLVVSFLSKNTYFVPLVFARTNHPKNEWMFTKMWGVDVAVSTAAVIYSLIEKEVSLGDVVALMRLSTEDMVIDEVTLPADAEACGKTLAELHLPRVRSHHGDHLGRRCRCAEGRHGAQRGGRGADPLGGRRGGQASRNLRGAHGAAVGP